MTVFSTNSEKHLIINDERRRRLCDSPAEKIGRGTDYRIRHPQDVRQLQLVRFRRYESLSSRGCGLWRIQSGYVRSLTWDITGELVSLGFWTVGDVVGLSAAASCQKNMAHTHPYEAQCLTAVAAEYLGSHRSFSREDLLTQLDQSNRLLRISHCQRTETRLLLFMCWIAERFGKPTPEGYQINIKLTHQEMAESISTTRVTVSRLIKVLERKGKIQWTAHKKQVNRIALNECHAA